VLVLYLAVKVFDPAVRPVTRKVLFTDVAVFPETVIEFASEALTPVALNDMNEFAEPVLPCMVAVRVTIAVPEAGMVTVTDGPAPAAKSV
jgi:hypothetical protein